MNLPNMDVIQFPVQARKNADTKRGAQILLVNANADLCELLAGILKKAGYTRIIEAVDGDEAVMQLHLHPVDLLITDIHMPRLDGWRLARMVRSGLFPCPKTTPIIAVSATCNERIAETTAREFEINRFLPLPMQNRADLVASVQELLTENPIVIKKPRLLIVATDPDSAIAAMKMLHHRFDIEVVTDGRSGLHAWRERRHDLVVLDVMLPKMAEAEVLADIMDDDPHQAVVIVTDGGSTQRCKDLRLGEAVDFISKPFRAKQLRHICEMAVRRNDYLMSNHQLLERSRNLKTVQEHHSEIADAHQHLMDNLSSVIFKLDEQGRLRFLNRAWERISGHKIHESIGRNFYDLLHAEDRDQYLSVIHSLANGRKVHHEQEVRLLNISGETLWIELSMDFKRHPESGVNSIYGHFADITERKLAVRQLEHLTIHDSLTGLYNRRYFEISLEHVIAGSARSELPHALLYIDLDHFQMVNSCFSHRDGDLALKEISVLLASRTREADLLCRMGGDEFAMLLTNTDSQRAMAVAEGLVDVLNGYQYSRDGHRITIGCSIGISMIDGDRSSSCEYLIRADKASFVAKSRGRNLVHIYNPEDREDDELRQGIDWAHRVRQALGDNRLDLYIQPVREVATGNINYYEALLRLRSQDLTTIIAPGVFIPAMEKAGQIHLLDRWVINRAIESLSQYPELERLAVNLSGRAFADPQLPAFVENLLLKHGVDPKRIIFEITETASIANINQTQHMIQRLRGLGCHFALDDFGTGYCSFHYLRQLPVDYIKLDGSYIKNIVDNEFDRAMVRSMNEIAHLLGKKTVAECVETDEVLTYLKDIGVDYVQGYSIGDVHPLETLCR